MVNRGNSSNSNGNTPSSQNINGLHRERSDSTSYVDPQTIANINTITKKYERYIKKTYGTLVGFEDAIKRATETSIKSLEKEKNVNEKLNKELNALANEFGESSKQFKTHVRVANKEMKLAKNESKQNLLNIEKEFIKQSFKNETKRNEIKFMSNKFSKGNNLANTSNEYYNQLEKLKSDALEVYGTNFENNKEYKKALLNLNDTYAKEMKDSWKEDFKENHKVLGGIADGIKDTFDRNKESLQGILGPLNLFIAPMKEFFGGFGAVFKLIGGGAKRIFMKFTKKNPTASDVLKSGAYGIGSLYIGHKLDELFGKTKGKNDLSSISDKFKEFGGTLSTLNKAVTSFSSLATVAGLGLVIKDAIGGWNKGDEWGTEKWASMIGSIVGSTSSGASGAVQGAIKYAMLGAPFGITGILVGGLLGGILGFFGGEFWAQGLQDFKNLITGKTNINEIRKRDLLKNVDKSKDFNQTQKNIMYKLADTLSEEDFVKLGNNLSNGHSALKGTVENWLKGNLDSLSEDELVSLLQVQTGFKGINKGNVNQYKEFFKKLHGTFDDIGLANIYRNPEVLASNMEYLRKISSEYQNYKTNPEDIIFLQGVLKKLGFADGVNSEEFKQLVKSGLLDSDYKFFFDQQMITDFNKIKNKNKSNEFLNGLNYSVTDVNDAIIRTDGSIIKTNPKDTLVALKDVPLSMEKVRNDTTKNLNSSLNGLGNDKTLEKKLTTIIDVLSKILAKDVQVNLPPQTRNDLDMIMSGGLI